MGQLKDYLPLYLGAQHRYKFVDSDNWSVWIELLPHRLPRLEDASIDAIQLALRPLSDMTEEDFYSFNQPETEKDMLITATINKRWCAGWYDKKEYEERVKEELCTDAEDLLYDLEDADHENVICCDKNGTISHGLNDDYCYFVDLPTISNWINHLRKRGFDCDRLIESGLAIDKTKI